MCPALPAQEGVAGEGPHRDSGSWAGRWGQYGASLSTAMRMGRLVQPSHVPKRERQWDGRASQPASPELCLTPPHRPPCALPVPSLCPPLSAHRAALASCSAHATAENTISLAATSLTATPPPTSPDAERLSPLVTSPRQPAWTPVSQAMAPPAEKHPQDPSRSVPHSWATGPQSLTTVPGAPSSAPPGPEAQGRDPPLPPCPPGTGPLAPASSLRAPTP